MKDLEKKNILTLPAFDIELFRFETPEWTNYYRGFCTC